MLVLGENRRLEATCSAKDDCLYTRVSEDIGSTGYDREHLRMSVPAAIGTAFRADHTYSVWVVALDAKGRTVARELVNYVLDP